MRNRELLATLCCLLLSVTVPVEVAIAQDSPQAAVEASGAAFELQNGDRVVFLGNSLFENDLPYGYLEYTLTTRWPNRDVTYRNIGWSGDTVWGEARSYISSPSAYDLLMEQLTKAQPTIVFIAYGANEALEGEAGLPRFKQGLTQLLDKVNELGAKAILLSPIPVMAAGTAENLEQRNAMLELYASAVAKTASDRGLKFIDVFNPLLERSKNATLSDNGLHLNENGYYHLASTIEDELGLAPRSKESVRLAVSKDAVEVTGPAKVLDAGKNSGTIKFTVDEAYLPLPLPDEGGVTANNARVFRITGLKRGKYTLSTGNFQKITASANEWEKGIEVPQAASFSQASQLREKIVKKNGLFFHQYRPLNRTYIIGFRSHEQGRHMKGLEDLSIIISWLEGQIALDRMPAPTAYQLSRTR
ncbi:SGNH/GDSL hydrolase family protein [Pontibacter toksunensis]|uniref:SGNH/GDSL hydrolase family protein n=1 Tax=Pontibacter toksunensis TaxID=1332631 RepID=A0ABW6BXC8_9BACT